MNHSERKEAGKLYRTDDPVLRQAQQQTLALMDAYNQLPCTEWGARKALLKKMFVSFGEESYVEGQIHANWGGRFCHIGHSVYINFNLTMVDDGPIVIEDCVQIGPNVTLISGSHPVDPGLRNRLWQYTEPVRIGKNSWIGAGVIILPGVEIGENSVIGAGSVVTRSIPADSVAAGNPCRVMRKITKQDRFCYGRGSRIDQELEELLYRQLQQGE